MIFASLVFLRKVREVGSISLSDGVEYKSDRIEAQLGLYIHLQRADGQVFSPSQSPTPVPWMNKSLMWKDIRTKRRTPMLTKRKMKSLA